MEIRLKTADEFRADHVTIEIRLTGEEARSTEDSYVPPTGYDPAKAAEVLAENYQRATDKVKELENQLSRWMNGHVCTDRCSEDKHVAFIGRQRLMDLEADIARRIENQVELERQLNAAQEAREIETRRAKGYGQDRYAERDRADKAEEDNKVLLGQRDAALRTFKETEADRNKLETLISEIKGHITAEGLDQAVELALFVDSREAHIRLNEIEKAALLLGKAVAKVRTALRPTT